MEKNETGMRVVSFLIPHSIRKMAKIVCIFSLNQQDGDWPSRLEEINTQKIAHISLLPTNMLPNETKPN